MTPIGDSPEPGRTERKSPTPDELRAMLEPGWDPTKQWDGSPAILGDTATVRPAVRRPTPGKREMPPHRRQPASDPVRIDEGRAVRIGQWIAILILVAGVAAIVLGVLREAAP